MWHAWSFKDTQWLLIISDWNRRQDRWSWKRRRRFLYNRGREVSKRQVWMTSNSEASQEVWVSSTVHIQYFLNAISFPIDSFRCWKYNFVQREDNPTNELSREVQIWEFSDAQNVSGLPLRERKAFPGVGNWHLRRWWQQLLQIMTTHCYRMFNRINRIW